MGVFVYDTPANMVEIDDRTLAHLRVVVMTKLRRSEPFMFDVQLHDGTGRRAFWIHPAVALMFRFYDSRPPRINRLWIEELIAAASGPDGLTLLPEPSPLGQSHDRVDTRTESAAAR